jgi:hypothetical protein
MERIVEKTLMEGGVQTGTLYRCMCRTKGCDWFDTGRAVQVDMDDKVYERPGTREGEGRGMEKTYEEMSPDQLAFGRRVLEDAAGRDLRDELG